MKYRRLFQLVQDNPSKIVWACAIIPALFYDLAKTSEIIFEVLNFQQNAQTQSNTEQKIRDHSFFFPEVTLTRGIWGVGP